MLVIDTSALLAALAGAPAPEGLIDRLEADGDLHAPHLLDTEALHALRGLERSGKLTADRAFDVRTDLAALNIARHPHEPLGDRVWALRGTLSAYDATFVALADLLGATLVTCDAKLAAAASDRADIELYRAA
jgi:predicted nucleic acid-binding protein